MGIMSSSLASDDQIIKALEDPNVLVLDVRGPAEYQSGCFAGAVNIPVDALPGRLAELGSKDRPIITYCAVGGRSGRAGGLLRSNGFTHVYCTTNSQHVCELAKQCNKCTK